MKVEFAGFAMASLGVILCLSASSPIAIGADVSLIVAGVMVMVIFGGDNGKKRM